MSHPQPPQHQPPPSERQVYARAIHNTALVAVVACPALALLPPRKLDFYTVGLVGTTVYSANYLIKESSGRSIWQHVSRRPQPAARPEQAVALTSNSALGEVQQELREQRETWKSQRQREIREDVEEGKGFGDMIIGQIWDVWNWGRHSEEEEKGVGEDQRDG